MIELYDDLYIDFDANRIWAINQPATWIIGDRYEGSGLSHFGYYPLKMLVSLSIMEDQIVGFKNSTTLSLDNGQYQHRIQRRNLVFFDDNHLRYDFAHLSHGSHGNVEKDDHEVLVITVWVTRSDRILNLFTHFMNNRKVLQYFRGNHGGSSLTRRAITADFIHRNATGFGFSDAV